MTRREEIKNLRSLGLTYKEIIQKTGYSKGIIAYYLNSTTKNKILERTRKARNGEQIEKLNKYNLPPFLITKIWRFRNRRISKSITKSLFSINEFYEKHGRHTKCYLTGKDIDLFQVDSCEFDHIIPISKGGTSSLDNLGISTPEANQAKSDLLLDDFYKLCENVIKYKETKQ